MSIPPRPDRAPVVGQDPKDKHGSLPVTRAGMVWVATITALVVLALLIVFMLQNQDHVQVQYLGLSGSLPLGIGLFIAAVAGGVLVAVAGAARISQLRRTATKSSRPASPRASWQPHRPHLKPRHHA
jgi:uncharacterized integral membrane protein